LYSTFKNETKCSENTILLKPVLKLILGSKDIYGLTEHVPDFKVALSFRLLNNNLVHDVLKANFLYGRSMKTKLLLL